jgi:predicted AAA+ superfamily ATPase
MMIIRQSYLDTLRDYRDTNLIKVLTGVRRCGKSTLLSQFRKQLIDDGVSSKNILSLNFEDLENEWMLNATVLHSYVLEQLGEGKNYVFLDEIQNVPNFEKVVDSLFIRESIDLYITGSNAYFLSSDLATVLSGRYVELPVYPLSFSEYIKAFDNHSRLDILFDSYCNYGGFPEVANLLAADKPLLVNDYLLGIFHTVLNKDVVQRNNISDVSTLNRIARFLLSNIGSLVSAKKIADFLTSNNNKTSYNTVDKYLSSLTGGMIFYCATRWNIKGKLVLQTLQKYFVVDTGLYRALLGTATHEDMGHILENIVYFELLRRRNFVWVGKHGESEVDFVVRNIDTDEISYYQVAYSVANKETFEREIAPLRAIKDHWKKTILTLDIHEFSEVGIRLQNIISWLLE